MPIDQSILFRAKRAAGGGALSQGLLQGVKATQLIKQTQLLSQKQQFAQDTSLVGNLSSIFGNKSLPVSMRTKALNQYIDFSNERFKSKYSKITESDFVNNDATFGKLSTKLLGIKKQFEEGKLNAREVRAAAAGLNLEFAKDFQEAEKGGKLIEAFTKPFQTEKSLKRIRAEAEAKRPPQTSLERIRAEAEARRAPIKKPTTIESALLDPNITPKRQNELIALKQALRGKGLTGRLTLPDGTVLEVGEVGIPEITKPVQTEIQKEMRNAKRQLEEIERIEKSGGVEEIAGFWNRITIMASNWAEFLGGKQLTPEKTRLDKDFNSMMRIMKIKFRKAQTGVAFNPIEAKEYNEIYPDLARDGEQSVKFKLAAIRKLSDRVIRSGKQFLSARDFLDAFSEEIQRVQITPQAAQAQEDLSELSDDEILRRTGIQ